MPVQRDDDMATMTTQRGKVPPELYSSAATAFSTPSRASLFLPVSGGAQLTTTVPVPRHYLSNPDAPFSRNPREDVSPPPSVLGKPRHRHILLPSQTESHAPIMIHPLLRPSRGSMMMELDFARSLSSVRVLGREGCEKELATSPPLPSLAIVYPNLPWPIVVQRSGDRECVTVVDVVETLWQALQIRDPTRSSSASTLTSSSLFSYQKDTTFNSCRSMSGGVEREMTPRLVYLKGKTRFMGLRAIGSDTWELLVA